MWKKYFVVTAATLCLLLPASASEASSATTYTTYTMTAAEMSALDSRLRLLLQHTKSTRQALSASRTELSKLKTESIKLQIELQAQSSLLESANKSLKASAKEEARTRRRIKAQRNTAIVAAVGLLAYAINK